MVTVGKVVDTEGLSNRMLVLKACSGIALKLTGKIPHALNPAFTSFGVTKDSLAEEKLTGQVVLVMRLEGLVIEDQKKTPVLSRG